jgi:hypothetical protein
MLRGGVTVVGCTVAQPASASGRSAEHVHRMVEQALASGKWFQPFMA